MKRRAFLTAGGAGLTVWLGGCSLPAIPVIPKRPAPDTQAALGWVHFDGTRYRLWLPRAEMGQHIDTAMRQIACEELGIDPPQLDVALPSTTDIGRVRATVGSDSVLAFAMPLAQACATLRDALARGQRRGVLAAEERPASQLRAFRDGARWVGASLPHPSQAAVVRGAPLFAADVRRPGTLYGRVLRAPASPDLVSRATGFDEAAARALPAFVALVRDDRLLQGRSLGLGILARTPGALDRIEAALAVRWQVSGGGVDQSRLALAVDVDARLAVGGLPHTLRSDRVGSASDRWMSTCAWTYRQRRTMPSSHAARSPSSAPTAAWMSGPARRTPSTCATWWPRQRGWAKRG